MTDVDTQRIRTLYERMLDGWNAQDAHAYGAGFSDDATAIGYDGSEMTGRATIVTTLQSIFKDHPTARYVSKVRFVRMLGEDTALLYAIVGMIPRGQTDIIPERNAIQTIVAARQGDDWHIVHFQNTPAQFHGRPDLVETMTAEIREELSKAKAS